MININEFNFFLNENKNLIGEEFETGTGEFINLTADLLASLEKWMYEQDIPFHTMKPKEREWAIESIIANLNMDDADIADIAAGKGIEITDDNFYSDSLDNMLANLRGEEIDEDDPGFGYVDMGEVPGMGGPDSFPSGDIAGYKNRSENPQSTITTDAFMDPDVKEKKKKYRKMHNLVSYVNYGNSTKTQ